jgi:hypothetical protein
MLKFLESLKSSISIRVIQRGLLMAHHLQRLNDTHKLMCIDRAAGLEYKAIAEKHGCAVVTVANAARSPLFKEEVEKVLDGVRKEVQHKMVQYATKATQTLYELCFDTHEIKYKDIKGKEHSEIQVTKPGDRIAAAGKILQGSKILEPDSGQKIIHMNMFAPKWHDERNKDGTIDVTLNQDE